MASEQAIQLTPERLEADRMQRLGLLIRIAQIKSEWIRAGSPPDWTPEPVAVERLEVA